MSSASYDHAPKTEANNTSTEHLERLRTVGGHVDDRTQPSLPVVHRSLANPSPLGLLSFATGMILHDIISENSN
jgi:succinate-acetate transporter protein